MSHNFDESVQKSFKSSTNSRKEENADNLFFYFNKEIIIEYNKLIIVIKKNLHSEILI